MTEEMKFCRQSRVYRSGRVFPNDFNNHNTLFGGRLLSDMDQVASIAASKHSLSGCGGIFASNSPRRICNV